jgi:plasmid stabilization system protein ParE
MKVRLLRSAFLDLVDGRRFYERQSPGLGEYFFASLFSDIDTLEAYGGIHRQLFDYHRALSKRFPYAVYYKIINQEVVVFRVLDCRQNPMEIRRFLSPDQ